VPVGFEVAKALNVPLDVFVVRKLGVPGYEELAMGAIASGGVWVLNEGLVRSAGIPDEVIEAVAAREERELERRERDYREGRPPLDVRGRTVILVDDGLATGSSMHVAVLALKRKRPAQIVVAGLAMVLVHNVWCGGALPIIVTLAGWLTLIKGLLFLFLPADVAVGFFLGGLHYEHLFYLYAAMCFVLGAYLAYGGFKHQK
jgi:hypothetical protein